MAQEFTPQELEKLLAYASGRLNTSPEALKAAFEKDGLYGLAQQASAAPALKPQEAAQVETLLQDKEQLNRLMDSPQVRQLLAKLLSEP